MDAGVYDSTTSSQTSESEIVRVIENHLDRDAIHAIPPEKAMRIVRAAIRRSALEVHQEHP